MSGNNIHLTPGEKGLYRRSFRPNLILFWLRTTILVTNKRIAVKYPNTILGVIPLGFEDRSMPIGSVAGLDTSLRVKAGQVIAGFFVAVLGVVLMGQVGSAIFYGLVLLLIGVLVLLSGITSSLSVMNNGGGTVETTVSIAERAGLDSFRNRATEIIFSASAGGESWESQYADNTDEFQNLNTEKTDPWNWATPSMQHYNLYKEIGLDSAKSTEELAKNIEALASIIDSSDEKRVRDLDLGRAILANPGRRRLYDLRINDPESDTVTIDRLKSLATMQVPQPQSLPQSKPQPQSQPQPQAPRQDDWGQGGSGQASF